MVPFFLTVDKTVTECYSFIHKYKGVSYMSKSWHEERFQKALDKSVYTLVAGERLVTGNTRVKLVCENGHDNYKSPLQIERGVGCAVCKGVAPLTQEEVERRLVDTKFKLAPGFKYKSGHNVDVVCDNGHHMSMKLYDITVGGGCYLCSVTPPWDIERVKSYTDPLGLTILDESLPVHSKRHIEMRCSKGHRIRLTPHALREGVGCSRCNKSTGRVHVEDMKVRLANVGLEMVDETEYKNVTKKIHVRCGRGHITDVIPSNTYSGHGCRLCKTSEGEQLVEDALNKLNIPYVREKTFPTCKNVLVLPFDFYVESLNLLIEYDGIQHHEAIDYFGGQEHLKYVQYLDSIKTKWAEDNGVTLLRIPYTEIKNVFSIVENKTSSLKK